MTSRQYPHTTTSDRAEFTLLDGGGGVLLMAAVPGPDLASAGYVEQEYRAHGEAATLRAVRPIQADGRFELGFDTPTAAFATRVVVRKPADPGNFNGTLVVEWLNVSSGQDAGPGYTYLATELARGGYAWAGVSAQWAGIESGTPTIAVPIDDNPVRPGLALLDTDRYGTLSHPGDAYCYDMFGRIARGLRDTGSAPLAGLTVDRMLAIGESQSAVALTTYINGVHTLHDVFDGFLVHSRGGSPAPLGAPGRGFDLRAALRNGVPTQIRDDGTAPTIVVQTETDLFGHLAYLPARQPDSDHFRLWEIAGAAHADKFMVGEFETYLGCSQAVNRGQQSFVLRAALRSLDAWVRTGATPPTAARLATDVGAGGPEFVVDSNGNVRDGVRTPAVDAPVATLSGAPAPDASPICQLFGTTTPLPESRLRTLYPSRDAYLDRYRAATEEAIAGGFVLADDRDELLALAEPSLIDW